MLLMIDDVFLLLAGVEYEVSQKTAAGEYRSVSRKP